MPVEIERAIYWNHLPRTTNLMVIVNISMFFLTEPVTRHKDDYTFYAILSLGIVYVGMLMPLGLLGKLWYDMIMVTFVGCGAYFLIASAWFWAATNR